MATTHSLPTIGDWLSRSFSSLGSRWFPLTVLGFAGFLLSVLGAALVLMPDSRLDDLVRMARNDPERVFRMESIITLLIVKELGSISQKELAGNVLTELTEHEDEFVAAFARRYLDHPLDAEFLDQLIKE